MKGNRSEEPAGSLWQVHLTCEKEWNKAELVEAGFGETTVKSSLAFLLRGAS